MVLLSVHFHDTTSGAERRSGVDEHEACPEGDRDARAGRKDEHLGWLAQPVTAGDPTRIEPPSRPCRRKQPEVTPGRPQAHGVLFDLERHARVKEHLEQVRAYSVELVIEPPEASRPVERDASRMGDGLAQAPIASVRASEYVAVRL
jgi:hypothetical protein